MLDIIKPHITIENVSETRAKFKVEPLERGFGYTLGNSLRRLILSSLPGAAVAAVRIEGVSHEFSAIPGVKEDVVDVILNIKSIVLRSELDEEATVRLKKTGKGVITAADLECPTGVEIINKDQVIATMSEKGKLEMELTIRKGRGYHSAERNKTADQPIGVIPIDSLYTPIRRITYEVGHTRVGQRTDYDSLVLDIDTNGAVSPEEAVAVAARIMHEHVNLFLPEGIIDSLPEVFGEDLEVDTTDTSLPLEQLELSQRSFNSLRRAGIDTLDKLVAKSKAELQNIRNFGDVSLNEVIECLERKGLSLKSA